MVFEPEYLRFFQARFEPLPKHTAASDDETELEADTMKA
jgi:hypothetical protein